jgi:hypothetical protein
MKLADKKRIPLSQIKLTKSWMDAPEQGVAEGKEELHTQLQSINQKLKLMRGGPVGEPNSMVFVEKRKELLKQKEQILSQLKQGVAEEWSQKYKSSINCSNPKGFSQKAHCAGKKK